MTAKSIVTVTPLVAKGLFIVALALCQPQPGWSQESGGSLSSREFYRSLTDVERKLPQSVVIERRLEAGLPVP